MVSIMDSTTYNQHAIALGPLKPSTQVMQMANGALVPSLGAWVWEVGLMGVQTMARGEVFDSGGKWEVLLGKPWLEDLSIQHHFDTDSLHLPTNPTPTIILNIHKKQAEHTCLGDMNISPTRRVPLVLPETETQAIASKPNLISTLTDPQFPDNMVFSIDPPIPLRQKEPFSSLRVEKILSQVKIGLDLTPDQRHEVQALVAEFSDIFALSLREVLPVTGYEHQL